MKLLFTLLLTLFLSACGGGSYTENCDEDEHFPIPPRQLSVSCLGDSISSGYVAGTTVPDYPKSFCNLLTQSYRISYVNNYAVPSKDITQIYNEQLTLLLARPTQAVIIATGYNDSYHNINLQEFKQKYESIIFLVKAKGMQPYCMTMPISSVSVVDVTEYNNITLTMVERGCTIIPIHSYYKAEWRQEFPNDLHFTAKAYEEIRNIILTYVKE
jgi:lysophospholipase L1-like esterase